MVKIVATIFVASVGVIGFALLSGCSSTTAGTENSTTSVTAPRKGTQPDIRKAQSQSSLEYLRRGEILATPNDSPLQEIYFDLDEYGLRPDARKTLRANAEWLKNNPSILVDVEGHCDERGTTEYNLALGAKRAQAAADYLIALGVSAHRLSITSFGKEVQVCLEHTEACWQRNRRGRFVARSGKPGV